MQFTYAKQALVDAVGMVHPEDAYGGEEYAQNATVQAARFVGEKYKAKWLQAGVDLGDGQQVQAAAMAEIDAISPCPNAECGSRRVYLVTTESTAAPFEFTDPTPMCRNCDLPG